MSKRAAAFVIGIAAGFGFVGYVCVQVVRSARVIEHDEEAHDWYSRFVADDLPEARTNIRQVRLAVADLEAHIHERIAAQRSQFALASTVEMPCSNH